MGTFLKCPRCGMIDNSRTRCSSCGYEEAEPKKLDESGGDINISDLTALGWLLVLLSAAAMVGVGIPVAALIHEHFPEARFGGGSTSSRMEVVLIAALPALAVGVGVFFAGKWACEKVFKKAVIRRPR
jgi:hypothetical protein